MIHQTANLFFPLKFLFYGGTKWIGGLLAKLRASIEFKSSFSSPKNGTEVVVCASKNANNNPLTGFVFAPFEEVKKELNLVPAAPQVSLARHKFTDQCEAAINEQINVEYNVLYVYHAMFTYFDRHNVAVRHKGFQGIK